MATTSEEVTRIITELQSGCEGKQVQAALQLRNLAAEARNKDIIREAGGIQVLLRLLESGHKNDLTTVSAESISCLAADDLQNRVSITS